jgi:hypothetical protein
MHEYEIRILHDDGTPALICEEVQLNDQAAIRSASRMALGRPFEVWRGLDCIRPVPASVPAEAIAPGRDLAG